MKSMDMFDSIVGISYNGERRFKSAIGGILFCVTFALCLAAFIFYSKKFIDRDDPKMIFEEQKFWDPPVIDMSNFKIAFLMKFGGNNEFHQNVLTTSAVFRNIQIKTKNDTEEPLNLIPCKKDYFKGAEDQYDSLEIEKGMCIDTTNRTIQGSSVNDILSYISIKFILCLKGPNCLPSSELANFFSKNKPSAFIYIYDSSFYPRNKREFKRNFISFHEVIVTFNNAKFTNIFLAENEMEIDDGFFLVENKNSIKGIAFESYRDSVSVRTAEQNDSLYLNIMSHNKKKKIHISYMQLSELFANLGAVISNIFLLFKFFINYVNDELYQHELIEKLIKLDKQDDFDHLIPNYKSSRFNSINPKHSSTSRQTNTNLNQFKLNLKSKDDKIIIGTMTHKDFKHTTNRKIICFSLRRIFCRPLKSKEDTKIHENLKKRISSKQDLKQIVSLNMDVELLKYLLFDENQIKIFNYIKIPSLFYSEELKPTNDYSKYFFSTDRDKSDNLSSVDVVVENKPGRQCEYEKRMMNFFK